MLNRDVSALLFLCGILSTSVSLLTMCLDGWTSISAKNLVAKRPEGQTSEFAQSPVDICWNSDTELSNNNIQHIILKALNFVDFSDSTCAETVPAVFTTIFVRKLGIWHLVDRLILWHDLGTKLDKPWEIDDLLFYNPVFFFGTVFFLTWSSLPF